MPPFYKSADSADAPTPGIGLLGLAPYAASAAYGGTLMNRVFKPVGEAFNGAQRSEIAKLLADHVRAGGERVPILPRGDGPAFQFEPSRVEMGGKYNAGVLSHELGHARQSKNLLVNGLQHHSSRAGLYGGILGAGFHQDEDVAKGSAAVGTALMAPKLLNEVDASVRGYAGVRRALPGKGRLGALAAFSGLPTYFGAASLPAGVYAGRKLSGRFDAAPSTLSETKTAGYSSKGKDAWPTQGSTMFNADHLINPALLQMTKRASRLGGFGKSAFVPGGEGMGGDPAAAGGAPPGGDPAAGGGAPPGGDPAAGGGGGGAPPSDPRIDQLMQMMTQMQQQQAQGGAAGAGGAGGAGAALKPKIDVNVEIMQMKNMMAKICDSLGVQIPAQDMTATPDKLMAMSQGQSTAAPAPGGAGGGAPPGGGAIGGMPPMDPMQGAGQPGADKMGSYRPNGIAFDTTGLGDNFNKAAAIVALRKRMKQAA